jgi:hypothetical protein
MFFRFVNHFISRVNQFFCFDCPQWVYDKEGCSKAQFVSGPVLVSLGDHDLDET